MSESNSITEKPALDRLADLAWAAGKRDDQPLDMRQSKIHFGILSVF